jgi:hypothetical protein
MSRKDKRYKTPLEAGRLAIIIAFHAGTLFVGPPALAQGERNQPQPYQLRANIAMAHSISPETAKRYGIGQDPRNALVDVVVARTDGNHETVPATVKVTASNLAGQTSHVKMQAISEAGRVSHLGVYKSAPDEVVDFDVLARPENSNEELRAQGRGRFPPDYVFGMR